MITDAGKKHLNEHEGQIHRSELVELQRQLQANDSDATQSQVMATTDSVVGEMASEELMLWAHRETMRGLQGDLRTSINRVSPDRFEVLVVDLLEAMGYGEGRAMGRSGDGGIDGIINQDALGLEKVYVQAKRYTSGAVGEPEIRNFAGSMISRGATKGVFITTSSFSGTARQTAANVSQRNETIRLVDGDELAQLMIRYGVGVVTEYTYEIKKLDENYFSDEV